MNKSAIVKLFVASAIVGLFIGLISDLFIRAIQEANKLIWTDWISHAQDKPIAVISIATAGGIFMGLCVKFFGTNDEGIGFEAVLVALKKDGSLGLKQIKRVVVNTYAGLITGASIGPEAPLVTLGGYCGELLARTLKTSKQQVMALITISLGGSMGVLVDSPVAGPILFAEQPPTQDSNTNRLLVFTSMVAASFGFGVYLLLGAPLLSGQKLVPEYGGFKFIHLFYALIIGALGMIIGISLKFLILKIRQLSFRFKKWPVAKGALVGLVIGIFGAIFPLVLFDGSAQLSQLVHNASQYSILMLFTLAAIRLISTGIALGGGYQGGNIFPSIFIAGATGLAIHAMFPSVPAPVAMVACMASTMYVFIPMPLFAIFLFTEISSFSLIPVMAMSLVAAYLLHELKRKSPTKKANRGLAKN